MAASTTSPVCPGAQGAHALAIDDDGQHARLGGGGIVADELRGAELVQKIAVDAAVGGPGRLGVLRAGGAGALALGLHGGLEGLHVHFHAAAFRDLLGHFHGEAVSIVQGEGLLAGEHVALKLAEGLLQVGLALAQGGAEAVLLGHDEAALQLAVLHDLGYTSPMSRTISSTYSLRKCPSMPMSWAFMMARRNRRRST